MNSLFDVYQTKTPVALVTGSGAPRVGQAIAKHLAYLGCSIGLHAHESSDAAEVAALELQDLYGSEVLITSGSLQEHATAERLVREVVEHFGRIDILVNSAAIWFPTSIEDITPKELVDYFEINTMSSWLAARAAGLQMVQQESGGSIINISDWATDRPYLDHAAYFPSKGGVDAMTRSLAVELAHRNSRIRVNCIKPGPVLLADEVDQQQADRIANSTLVKRVGTAEHIAHAVQFLCENDFVNGIAMPVDGGRTIYAPDGLQVGMNTG